MTVFLGGSCNPTTWRHTIAVPMLHEANVAFYNPQREAWSEGLLQEETNAKKNSTILLFVIDSATRAVSSMVEASEYIASGRDIMLVVMPDVLSNQEFEDGVPVGASEMKDLNRARAYLRDVAKRHGCIVYDDVASGVREVIRKFRLQAADPGREANPMVVMYYLVFYFTLCMAVGISFYHASKDSSSARSSRYCSWHA